MRINASDLRSSMLTWAKYDWLSADLGTVFFELFKSDRNQIPTSGLTHQTHVNERRETAASYSYSAYNTAIDSNSTTDKLVVRA